MAFTQVREGIALAGVDGRPAHAQDDAARGDVVVEVDGLSPESYLDGFRLSPGSTRDQRRANAVRSLSWQDRFPHEVPSPSLVVLCTAEGHRSALSLPWTSVRRDAPTPRCVRAEVLGGGVGLLEIRSFYCRDGLGQVSDAEFARQAFAAAEALRGAEGIAVDLRGNSGGRDQQAQIAAGLFTPDAIEWLRHRHPASTHELALPPGPEPTYLEPALRSSSTLFGRRLCLLTGPATFSTAELFAAALRNGCGAHLVGGRTAGGAGNPVEFRLPYSGLSLSVPVAEYFAPGPSGASIEGNGLEPEISAVQELDDLRAGRDSVLARARDVLRS
jgi:C-terminal processing protease CtpA/Prc